MISRSCFELFRQNVHVKILVVLSLSCIPVISTAGWHDGHVPRPLDSNTLTADKQDQAGGDEAARGDGEEHEEDGLGGDQIISPDYKLWSVRRVETGESENDSC